MKNNSELSRYELSIDGHVVYATYRITKNIINLDYVFAPEPLRGTGAASNLMQEIVKDAVAKNMKIHPICGYAVAWARKHKQYNFIYA